MTVLVEARGLVKRFRSGSLLRGRAETRALDGVSLEIREGEVLALIGESGSGKTTLGKVLLRLTTLDEGTVRFAGDDIFALDRRQLRVKRRDFQMVFQNQRANLHPKMTVQQMLDESLRLHRPDLDAEGRAARITELLERVGLAARAAQRPASLSGGERRRVGLARILATRPRLIVADEPTSGLDAAIKLQIIELLRTLKDEKLTYLLISHDLGLVRRIADRVLVMLSGRIIEEVPADRLGGPQHHPYTGRLMRAAHLLDDREKVTGREPQANAGDGGCVYAADCPVARERGIQARCRAERPPFVELAAGHRVACFASEAGVAEPGQEDA
ncbi:MAG: ABC transporter ATP-binding protein [Myxococcales bacterium]|nr:ABC transporter ATP-binding protein [Myxococcales bacterium]MCB9549108.1 ABC transporter ATP-binding protein [Myxococcales bacterium]